MTESTVFADPFAAECKEARNKKAQRPKRGQSDHRCQNDRRHLVGHHMSSVVEDVLSPGCSDDTSNDQRDGRKGLNHETDEADPSVSVRMGWYDLQILPGK